MIQNGFKTNKQVVFKISIPPPASECCACLFACWLSVFPFLLPQGQWSLYLRNIVERVNNEDGEGKVVFHHLVSCSGLPWPWRYLLHFYDSSSPGKVKKHFPFVKLLIDKWIIFNINDWMLNMPSVGLDSQDSRTEWLEKFYLNHSRGEERLLKNAAYQSTV